MDVILIETVGVGQTELDIMEIADTTVVIVTPESGDAIQTLKAGILEIADIFVVNKADRDGSHLMQAELKAMLELGGRPMTWVPPVLLVQANKDQGVVELLQAIEAHRAQRTAVDSERKQKVALEEVKEIVLEEISGRLAEKLPKIALKTSKGNLDNPYEVAQILLDKITGI
jgi:LAO/AO transport system kinase